MADGTMQECLTSQTVQNQSKNGLTHEEIAYTVSSPFGAGIETVSANIYSGERRRREAHTEIDIVYTLCLYSYVSAAPSHATLPDAL